MRIIHCADIHLDSSLNTHLTLKQATVRKNEILNTFYRMTVFAKENDLFVTVGSDFHNKDGHSRGIGFSNTDFTLDDETIDEIIMNLNR